MSDERIAELTALAEEHGARIHVVRCVKVNQGRDWNQAIRHAGPDTLATYHILKPEVAALFPPVSDQIITKDFVLLNYPNCDGWNRASDWGEMVKLKRTNPREVFAIGEKKHTLHYTLCHDPVSVFSTTRCMFQGDHSVCSVTWRDIFRLADLACTSLCDAHYDWFAFSDE